MDPQPPPVVLKKYGNRRLYDTSSSRYVTLAEVEAMVQRGADVMVLDAKSGDDITKEVLVQLLLERDEARAALPVGLLKQAVKLAGSPLKDTLARVIQEGLDGFLSSQRAVVDAQRAFSQQMAQLPWSQASSTMAQMWNPFAAMTPPPPRPGEPSAPQPQPQPPPPAQQPQPTELEALKAELSETQALVRKLLEREQASSSTKSNKPRKKAKKSR